MEQEDNQDDSSEDEEGPLISVLLQSAVAAVVMLLDESSSSEEEAAEHQQQINTRRTRTKRTKFEPAHADAFIQQHILGTNPTVNFKLMFRISKERFLYIHDAIRASGNKFFFGQQDEDNEEATISPAARIMLPIQCLAFGTPTNAFSTFYQMSPPMARRCCDEFDIAMNTLFVHEFLRKPTMEDLMAITTLHQSKHRVPGMFGSLDCMHTVWKNCPMAWHGSYQGKEKAPTLVLEAVCDYNLWFWHAFYGSPGSFNDINILRLSNLMTSFLDGSFADLERRAGVTPYAIGDEEFNQLFLLVDGIYPNYSRFVKGIKDPLSDKEKEYTKWQEATRKDIERAFGVLRSRWKFMAFPIHLMKVDKICHRVQTCLILHNMGVSDRVMKGDVTAKYNPAFALGEGGGDDVDADDADADDQDILESDSDSDSDIDMEEVQNEKEDEDGADLGEAQEYWKNLSNKEEHGRLYSALLLNASNK